MYNRDPGQQAVGEGLYTIEADFVTEHLVIRGEINGPDNRLSDHLNGSTTSVELRPSSVERANGTGKVDLALAHAQITKAQLLFTVPVKEPEKLVTPGNIAWTWTKTKRCWAALGGYGLIGKIHVEPGRDDVLILRALAQKQFLPMTEVSLTYPDGTTAEFPTVIVNRAHVEMVALRDALYDVDTA